MNILLAKLIKKDSEKNTLMLDTKKNEDITTDGTNINR